MNDFKFKTHAAPSLIGYYAAIAGVGLIAGALGPTLSNLAANTHTTLQGVSLIFIGFPIGYMVGALLGGRLLDRLPGHPIMAVSAAICFIALLLTPLVGSLAVLVFIMAIMGFSQAGLDVGANTLLGWIYKDKVGPYMNALHFFFGVGTMIASSVAGQVFHFTGGITWAYWILALLLLPVAVWQIRLPSPPSIHQQSKKRMAKTNWALLVLFVLFFLFYSGLELGYGNWVSSYAKDLRMEDEEHAAYLATLFWGALTAGRFVGIPISVKFGPVAVLLMDIVGCVISLGVVMLWPQDHWALWVGTAGAGFSMASIFPTLMTYAGQSLALTGQITSWFFIGASAGAIIFPWLIGQWFESVGPKVMVDMLAVIIVLMTIVFVALVAKTPKAAKK